MKIQSNLYALSKNDPAQARPNERPALTVADKAAAQVDNLQQSGENLAAAESRLADADAAKKVLDFVKQNLPSQNPGDLIKDSDESRRRIADLMAD